MSLKALAVPRFASVRPAQNDSMKIAELPTLAVASAHPFVQQTNDIRRKAAIFALVVAIQVAIVLLYLYFTGKVSVPFMLVPVTIIPATVH